MSLKFKWRWCNRIYLIGDLIEDLIDNQGRILVGGGPGAKYLVGALRNLTGTIIIT